MNALPYKSKQYGLITIKLLLLSLTLLYVVSRLNDQSASTYREISDGLQSLSLPVLLGLFLLASANWVLESIKWQKLVQPIRPMDFLEAFKQTLAGLALSMATPARIGDFGVKASYFPAPLRKRIILQNTISHAAQLLTTLVFGSIGIYQLLPRISSYLNTTYLSLISGLVVIGLLVGIYLWRFKFRQRRTKLKVGKLQLSVFLLSILRYLCFSGMFALLLQLEGIHLSWTESLPLIWTIYLLSSAIPGFLLLDVAIKGGVAVWLFSLFGVEAWPVLGAVSLMWLFNMILPAILGAWFSLGYRPAKR